MNAGVRKGAIAPLPTDVGRHPLCTADKQNSRGRPSTIFSDKTSLVFRRLFLFFRIRLDQVYTLIQKLCQVLGNCLANVEISLYKNTSDDK